MVNRRGFLAALAGLTLDPERALWVPGKKLISIPAPAKVVKRGGSFKLVAFEPTYEEIRAIADPRVENWEIMEAAGKALGYRVGQRRELLR